MRLLIASTILLFIFALFANATTVSLKWDANSEYDLAGYNVYMRRYTFKNFSAIGTTTNNLYTTSPLYHPVDSYLYFVVTAFNTSGLESNYSNVVEVYRPKVPDIAIPRLISKP